MDYKEILKNIKSGEFKNLALFYGSEDYIINNVLKKLKDSYVSKDFEALNYELLEGDQVRVDSIINSSETLPFMGDKRVVIVKNLECLLGKRKNISEDDEQKLIKYISDIPSTTFLIFVIHSEVDKRKKIFKEIKKLGTVGEFNKLVGMDLNKWVKKRFKDKGKEIQLREIRVLVESLGYEDKKSNKTLIDIDNEIEKISAYVGEKIEITKDDVEALCAKTLENNIFVLVEALAEGKIKKALTITNDMILQGEAIVMILHMIIRQFRYIYQVKLMLGMGYTNVGIAPKLGIQQFVVTKYIRQSKGFSLNQLKKILNILAHVDRNVKTGGMDPKLAVEQFIVNTKE